ncbi:MAG TPA: hypothetical protein VD859_00420 [Nocardioides sp.]|nr:hypothetical protein [Nocardioides sp.]
MGTRGHPGAGAGAAVEADAQRRVRELAREALSLMVFSAAVSLGVTVFLLLAHGLGR